jgi:hypothetical protein
MFTKSHLKNFINLTIFLLLVISKLNIIHTKPFDENDNNNILLAANDNNLETTKQLNDKDVTNKELDITKQQFIEQETTKKQEPFVNFLDTTQQKADVVLTTKAKEVETTTQQKEKETTTEGEEAENTSAVVETTTQQKIIETTTKAKEVESTSAIDETTKAQETTKTNAEQTTTENDQYIITTEDPNFDTGMSFILIILNI